MLEPLFLRISLFADNTAVLRQNVVKVKVKRCFEKEDYCQINGDDLAVLLFLLHRKICYRLSWFYVKQKRHR